MNPQTKLFAGLVAGSLTLAACGGSESPATNQTAAAPVRTEGTALVVKDTTLTSTFDAAGVAEPMQQATVSTKLMGTVTAVLVKEGDAVRTGQTLVQIDARDLAAKANQVAASIADAEAMQQEAATQRSNSGTRAPASLNGRFRVMPRPSARSSSPQMDLTCSRRATTELQRSGTPRQASSYGPCAVIQIVFGWLLFLLTEQTAHRQRRWNGQNLESWRPASHKPRCRRRRRLFRRVLTRRRTSCFRCAGWKRWRLGHRGG